MNNQNNNQDNNQNANVISPEEIQLSISGNEVALENQMERIKEMSRKGIDEATVKAQEEQRRLQQEAAQIAKRKKDEAEVKALQAKENAENQALMDEEAKKKAEEEMIKKAQQEELMKKKAEEEAKKQADELKKKQAEEALNKKMQEEEAAKKRQIEENIRKEAEKKRQEELEQQRKKQAAEQKQKEIEANGGTTKARRVTSAMILIGLIALVYFLPNISQFVEEYKASRMAQQKVTTGVSNCTLEKSTETLDVKITASFNIVNSKLQKLTYITVSTGDKTSNSDELNQLNQECLKLKEEAGELNGVTIACGLSNKKDKMSASNKQILDYEKLDVRKVTTAFTEAGGIYPEFTKNEDIDKIEGKMNVAGYTCSRS